MIKQGMNLTKEQRGEVKEEMKMEGTSAPADLSEDKKSMTENTDTKILQASAQIFGLSLISYYNHMCLIFCLIET